MQQETQIDAVTTHPARVIDPKKIKTVFNRGTVIRIYDPSPDDTKITLESYLAAGRPLHTDQNLLYRSDALDYIQSKENQAVGESS